MHIALGIDFDIQFAGGAIAGGGKKFTANALPQLLNRSGMAPRQGKTAQVRAGTERREKPVGATQSGAQTAPMP